ncbi:Pyridoxamine 5'-phosphate oxidase-like protein [Alcanivorax sp. MD8A]|uniref:HugZ family pyridoxamine 5'-phosphate oxidase n=1 Tax=Alcanivorax sp. MD8A TaxID=1177157 RepID=UPI000C9BB601|nr:pyridoxamine 5'-phosphate oxidase family protein [Alcanivorax sp. MD8A]PNE04365.1 Pyridoxamine 5'-phosphate oxidase-like protein [Alcanivorax sp. MD8A]
MSSEGFTRKINQEVVDFILSRRSLQLASIRDDGAPFASYAPFAIGDECLYVLISEIAVHARNLQANPLASVLIVEDENSAEELFARKRVNYLMDAEKLQEDSPEWKTGVDTLHQRLGERILNLSTLGDFKLFRLIPREGRYVKGFARAYQLEGKTLAGEAVNHMRDGHRKRKA